MSFGVFQAQLSDTKAAVARLQVAATQKEAELAETNKVKPLAHILLQSVLVYELS